MYNINIQKIASGSEKNRYKFESTKNSECNEGGISKRGGGEKGGQREILLGTQKRWVERGRVYLSFTSVVIRKFYIDS